MTAKPAVVMSLPRDIMFMRGLIFDHVKTYLHIFFPSLFYFIYLLFLHLLSGSALAYLLTCRSNNLLIAVRRKVVFYKMLF